MALRGAASRRYAESVFAIARDNSSFDRWLEDVDVIRDLLTQPDMKRFLDDPKTSVTVKEEALRKLLDGKVDKLAVNLAVLLVRREQVNSVSHLARDLRRLV